ncbi:MAG: helix-turn-helix domain-containing protein, partial [Synergistaceae bacterium]|nr:helix-turn-helix domain-containing protein [Synergistaceae bacterium]
IVKTLNKVYNKFMYDAKYKLRTLAYRNEGHTLAHTSNVFGISINTIRKWEKQLKEEGNFNRRPIQRRFRKIDPQKLKDYAAEHTCSSNW